MGEDIPGRKIVSRFKGLRYIIRPILYLDIVNINPLPYLVMKTYVHSKYYLISGPAITVNFRKSTRRLNFCRCSILRINFRNLKFSKRIVPNKITFCN